MYQTTKYCRTPLELGILHLQFFKLFVDTITFQISHNYELFIHPEYKWSITDAYKTEPIQAKVSKSNAILVDNNTIHSLINHMK